MPFYPIFDRRTGKRYRMAWDGPDKPDSESIKKFIYDEENRSTWNKINKPLSDLPSRIAKPISERLYKYGEAEPGGPLSSRGLARGAGALTESLGNVASSLTSPLSLGLFGLTGGTGAAARLGFGRTSQALVGAQRAAGAGLAGHGAYNVATGETLAEKLGGAVEALGGAAGVAFPYKGRPVAPRPISTPKPIPRAPKQIGPGRTITGPGDINAEFSVLPDMELPPGPSPAQLPGLKEPLALPPGRPPYYAGRRGVSQNLEDVGEIIGHGERAAPPYGTIGIIPNRYENLRGPGINIRGKGLENFELPSSPVKRKLPVERKLPTPKGAEDVSKRPFTETPIAKAIEEKRIMDFGAPKGISERRQSELLKKFGGTKAELETRDTIISRLNNLLKDEKGFVKLPSKESRKSIAKVYDDLATSGLTVIRKLGGKDLERLILKNRLDSEQLAGRINSKLKTITKDLTQEELANYIDVRDIGARPLNQKVADAFSQFKDVDSDVTRMAQMSGMGLRRGKKTVPFEPLGEEGRYFAHIYGPEFFKDKPRALESIMNEGYTLDQAERILKRASEYGERLIDPQHGRVVNAPGYRKDINVDYQHIDDMSRRIKQAVDFGPMDTADKGSPISRMIAATDDPIRVGKIVKRYLGREEPMDPNWARFNAGAVKFQSATKLSKFLINNTAQLGMIPVRAGFKNTGKALGRILFDYPGARSEAEITGALQPIHRELIREAGGPSGIAKWFGISKGEEWIRSTAAIAGKHSAKDLFQKLVKNPENARIRAQIEDLLLEDANKLLGQTKLTDWQINRAGARMSEVTQGRASSIDLPKLWTDFPAARLVMLYKRYAFQQSKNIKEAFRIMGPVKTAAILTGTSAILGEGIGDVNAVLRGTGRAIGGAGDIENEIAQAISDRGEGYDRLINNLAQAWALGYVGDVLESAGRGRGGIASNVAGPMIGDIDEASAALFAGGEQDDFKTSMGKKTRAVTAMGARMVPLFGTGLASAIRESDSSRNRRQRRGRARRGR